MPNNWPPEPGESVQLRVGLFPRPERVEVIAMKGQTLRGEDLIRVRHDDGRVLTHAVSGNVVTIFNFLHE